MIYIYYTDLRLEKLITCYRTSSPHKISALRLHTDGYQHPHCFLYVCIHHEQYEQNSLNKRLSSYLIRYCQNWKMCKNKKKYISTLENKTVPKESHRCLFFTNSHYVKSISTWQNYLLTFIHIGNIRFSCGSVRRRIQKTAEVLYLENTIFVI